MALYLRPIGDIDTTLLVELTAPLGRIFNEIVNIDQPAGIPELAYNPNRNQYHSSIILNSMMKSLHEDADKILGIADHDVCVPHLNFVFGEARERVAVISITRLRQEYYGLPKNDQLFKDRVVKEAVHEIGHMFGLRHCPEIRCVMHFSNSLEDTDIKSYRFCPKCEAQYSNVSIYC